MAYKGYMGEVEVEGDEFYGVVVNLHRDHVDFRGRSVDEVREAFHDSVDLYLKGCEEDGEEPESPFSGRFVVRLPPSTHRRASTLSRVENRRLNAVVTEAIEVYLADRGL